MHADGKSTLASVSKWNSRKVNCVVLPNSEQNQFCKEFWFTFLTLLEFEKKCLDSLTSPLCYALIPQRIGKCAIKIFMGAGGNNEKCLKWGGEGLGGH